MQQQRNGKTSPVTIVFHQAESNAYDKINGLVQKGKPVVKLDLEICIAVSNNDIRIHIAPTPRFSKTKLFNNGPVHLRQMPQIVQLPKKISK